MYYNICQTVPPPPMPLSTSTAQLTTLTVQTRRRGFVRWRTCWSACGIAVRNSAKLVEPKLSLWSISTTSSTMSWPRPFATSRRMSGLRGLAMSLHSLHLLSLQVPNTAVPCICLSIGSLTVSITNTRCMLYSRQLS